MMKAVVITAPRCVEIGELPDPQPGPGEVLVRLRAAGICGTDIHLYHGEFGTFPATPGHDAAGVIEAVGTGVSTDRIGRRVILDPAGCCARAAIEITYCAACSRGATHLCEAATYMGISAPGAMAQKVVVPQKRAVTLPDNISDDAATALEPVVVGLHLLEQIADRPGPVLIIGGGPIGIAAALLLIDAGRTVTLSEPLAVRRELAQALGIEKTVTPQALEGYFPGRVIVETSGHPSASETMITGASPGTTIVLVGGATDIPGLTILTRELEVRAAKGGRGLYPEALELVAAGKIDPLRWISHRFAVKDAAEAFVLTSERPDVVTRSVLDMAAW